MKEKAQSPRSQVVAVHRLEHLGTSDTPRIALSCTLPPGSSRGLSSQDAYWKCFRPHFAAAKQVVTAKFDEINSVRNAFAHFRPISVDDVDTVKQTSKHVLTLVEKTLASLVECRDTVPTNTSASWYANLKVLGTPLCNLSFHQSEDEHWIRVDLGYKSPVLRQATFGGDYTILSVLNVSAPAVLETFTSIRNVVTYVTEQLPYARVVPDIPPQFTKTISFGFAAHTLEQHEATVANEIKALLAAITEETELIQQDNLARGKLVRAISTSAQSSEQETPAYAQREPFSSGLRDTDPAEWWGEIVSYNPDFISATHRYPWMATDIARPSFPGYE